MLPSIEAPSKNLSSPKPKKSKPGSIKVNLVNDEEESNGRSAGGTFLPLLSEGSLTSYVSTNSSRSRWKEKIRERDGMKPGITKLKQRGGGFKGQVNQRQTEKSIADTSFTGVKTHDLQLQFRSAVNSNKGWSVQNPNPRLLKLQTNTGKFNADLTPFSFRNVNEYSFFSRTLATPHVDFLYHRKQTTVLKEDKLLITDGATIKDRFYCPPLVEGDSVLELPGSSSRLSHYPLLPASSSLRQESPQKKSCGRVHLIERDNISSRSLYNRWERKPTSSQRLKTSSSSGMTGGKVRVKPENVPPSPPKIPLKKNKDMSLENLRRRVKKVVNQSSHDKLNEKPRRSSITKTSNRKLKNKLESQTRTDQEVTKVDVDSDNDEEEHEIAGESCLTESSDIKEDVMDSKSETKLKEQSDHVINELTVQTIESSATTPTSIQRLTTPRILKINYNEEQNPGKFSSLKKIFAKLDSDGDGHLSFDELKRSLPSDLTKRQLDYFKKVYLMACESTFFGFEEFLAVNQMCDVLAHVNPTISSAYESMDINDIEEKLSKYLELFTHLDRKQTSSLDIPSFKEFLAFVSREQHNEYDLTEVLDLLGKANTDVVSKVDLLVLVPYLLRTTLS